MRKIIGLSGGNFISTVKLKYFVLFYTELFDLEFCFVLSIRIRKLLLISNVKREHVFLVLSAIHDIHPVLRKLAISLFTLK